jgi:hypothetical protein
MQVKLAPAYRKLIHQSRNHPLDYNILLINRKLDQQTRNFHMEM